MIAAITTDGPSVADRALARERLEGAVVGFIRETVCGNAPVIRGESRLREDLCASDLEVLQAAIEFGEQFHFPVEAWEMAEIRTVTDLVGFITEKTEAAPKF